MVIVIIVVVKGCIDVDRSINRGKVLILERRSYLDMDQYRLSFGPCFVKMVIIIVVEGCLYVDRIICIGQIMSLETRNYLDMDWVSSFILWPFGLLDIRWIDPSKTKL